MRRRLTVSALVVLFATVATVGANAMAADAAASPPLWTSKPSPWWPITSPMQKMDWPQCC
jgi:hypothetical protein